MSGPARILVVDDEPDVELLVVQKFRREIRKGEMSFVFAHDGQEALDVLSKEPEVAMVLSDINMPRMDGLTLLDRLEELHRDLRTVIISAYGDFDNIRAAMNRGAFDFLTKPVDFADLQATIEKTLKNLKEYRELNRQRSEAQAAHALLSRYFSPQVAEALSSGDGISELGGERRTATFLFTDLTDFTSLVESSDPDSIVELLNSYLDGVAQIIFRHEGTVMKVIGDAVEATFGAPLQQPDHCARAVACALEIDSFAEQHRAACAKKGMPLGHTRIGINTGEAIIGNFGGNSFFDYTAYGDAVNIAARLEAANKAIGTRICVSENVVQEIEGFLGRPSGRLVLKGRSEPLLTYEPLRSDEVNSDLLTEYVSAYEMMAEGSDGARAAFAALFSSNPDDPLVSCHLQRVLAGETNDILNDLPS